MSKIPPEKIHMGKKVKAINQSEDGVGLRCTDKTDFYGHILIGADGAYSAVRQNMYFQLKQEGLLPDSDSRAMNKGYVCLVGVTDPLDPDTFKGVDAQYSSGSIMISDNTPYTVSLSPATCCSLFCPLLTKVQFFFSCLFRFLCLVFFGS